MAEDNERKGDILILSDQEGNFYGIPCDRLDEHRLTGEQLDKARQILGTDDQVTGYGVDERFLPAQDQTQGIYHPMPVDGDEIAANIVSGEAAALGDPALRWSQYLSNAAVAPTVVGWMVSLAKNARIPI
jgi:hypothetical protein